MPKIELSDETYARAKLLADQRGFPSVDAFIANEIEGGFDSSEIEAMFTPELVSELQGIVAVREAGGPAYTVDEAMEMIAKERSGKKAS